MAKGRRGAGQGDVGNYRTTGAILPGEAVMFLRPLSIGLCALALAACPQPVSPGDDAGDDGEDAGADDDDAGRPGDDAGVPDDDAGPGGEDAGPDHDAGPGGSDAGPGSLGPYAEDGAAAVTELTRGADVSSGSFDLEIYLPATAGPRPVVVLAPGLLQPAAAYAPYGRRLASHGILTLIRDDPGVFTATPEVTAGIVETITEWLTDENADASSPLFGRADLDRVGLAGHSRGGKASLIAAEEGLNDVALAWFGLDPVDSTTLADGVLARDQLGVIGMPTAFLGAEISSTCSPAADNYAVLFEEAPTPSVQIVGLGAGHTQLQSQDHCVGCAACTPGGDAEDDVVLTYSVRYLSAFFARELLDDASVGAALQGAGAGIDVAAGRVQIESK